MILIWCGPTFADPLSKQIFSFSPWVHSASKARSAIQTKAPVIFSGENRNVSEESGERLPSEQ
jgi:hypothetical protein